MAEQEYKIIKRPSHDKLATALNEEAGQGWQPVNAYGVGWETDHFALLKRPAQAS